MVGDQQQREESGLGDNAGSRKSNALLSFEDIQRYFGCSLAEAAKGLEVSMTTVKRTCR